MTRPAACLLLAAVAVPAFAQKDPKEAAGQTYAVSLRVAGPPVPSFKYELVPAHRELEPNNAALLHHRALHLFADARPPAREYREAQDRFQKALDGPLAGFPREDVRAFLKPFGGMFKEMEAAARCDHCDWGTDQRLTAEGIGLLLPEVQRVRDLAFVLRLRCRLHAADGKLDPALRDVQTGLVLARHIGQGNTLIQFLVGTAIAAMFTAELEQVMQTSDCPNLYWSLTALPRPFIDIRRAMDGEMRSMEATLPLPKDVDKGPMTPEEALAALDRFWAAMVKLAEEPQPPDRAQARLGLALYVTLKHPSARKALIAAGKPEAEVDAMPAAQVVLLDALYRFRTARDEAFVWYHQPYPEAIQGFRKASADARAVREGPLDYLNLVLPLLMPAVDRVYRAQVRTDRRIATLRAVEAVRLHAAKNGGRLPEKLAEVSVVPVPTDPATGQAFAYSVEGDRFTIDVPPPPGDAPDRNNNWKYVVTLRK